MAGSNASSSNPLRREYRTADSLPEDAWRYEFAEREALDSLLMTRTGRIIEGPPAGSYWRVSKEKLRERGKLSKDSAAALPIA